MPHAASSKAPAYLENVVHVCVCVFEGQDACTQTRTLHAPRILPTLSWCYQIRETCCPSPHCNANEKECADKRPDPRDERPKGGVRQ